MYDAHWKKLDTPCPTESETESWRVKRILLTTFDTADAELLVEHLLPSWHGLKTQFDGDDQSRNPFLVELSETLESVESMVIISSSTLSKGSAPYPWLWRFITPAMVGMEQQAVQHAKLWMFQREALEPGNEDTLELCLSSANLTLSAFRDQVQAAWRCVVSLKRETEETETEQHLASWGVLPSFLSELARQCGRSAEAINAFRVLLGRAQCPKGVRFIASIPGTYSRKELEQRPLGLEALRQVMPETRGIPRVFATAPVVGSWKESDLKAWLAAAGCAPENFTLGWISRDVADFSGWCRNWILPSATARTLQQCGAHVDAIRNHDGMNLPRLHGSHRPGDRRWLHAKLYGFSCGHSHCLLVTSANFTPAAWGRWTADDKLRIENFELGVVVEKGHYPFKTQSLDESEVFVREPEFVELPAAIGWAEAEWDGQSILLSYRIVLADVRLDRVSIRWVENGLAGEQVVQPQVEERGVAHRVGIVWGNVSQVPFEAKLETTAGSMHFVPVSDARPLADRIKDPLPQPGLDKQTEEQIRERLLLRRYSGGTIAEDDRELEEETDVSDIDSLPSTSASMSADYGVKAFVQARKWFAVIDNWRRRLPAAGDSVLRDILRHDAEALLQYFGRNRELAKEPGDRVAAALVAEELQHYLDSGDCT